jgi:hypothetical protein
MAGEFLGATRRLLSEVVSNCVKKPGRSADPIETLVEIDTHHLAATGA